jgi:uncharacterized repeat protein (TIGR01451 family)
VDKPTPNEGDTIVYTLTVTNNGPSTATGVTLSDLLPLGVTYVSDDSGGLYNRTTGVWTVGTLQVGGSATITITATVDTGTAGSTIANTVEVGTSDQPDPDPSNNRATAIITVGETPAGGGGGVSGPCDGKVVINEIAWAGTQASPQDQWIELRNLGTTPVDLTGWTLRWRPKQPAPQAAQQWKIVDLSGFILPATASACAQEEQTASLVRFEKRTATDISWSIVTNNEAQDPGYYLLERLSDKTVSNVRANLIYDQSSPHALGLSPKGDVMELLNAQGVVVDTANASNPDRSGWPAGDARTFASMERTDPLKPDTWDNWHTDLGITTYGLDANGDPLIATADARNSETLTALTAAAQMPPEQIKAGTRLQITLDLTPAQRAALGWPWIRVTSLAIVSAAGGGGSVAGPGTGIGFSGRSNADTFKLGIDTQNMAAGRYDVWVVFGSGKAVVVPIEIAG